MVDIFSLDGNKIRCCWNGALPKFSPSYFTIGIQSKNWGSPVVFKLFKNLSSSKKFQMKMLTNQIKPADNLFCTCLILMEGKDVDF